MFRKCLGDPFVHFMFIGALLFSLYGLTSKDAFLKDDNDIQITAEAVNKLRQQWTRQNGSTPDSAVLDELVESLIHQEVLLREAKRLGLDENDTIVRRRLIQKMEFLSANLSQLQRPDEAVLLEYFKLHREQYRVPEKRSFTHIYFSKEKRGASVFDDAKEQLEMLSVAPTPLRAPERGDNFILQYDYRERSQQRVAQIFGVEFARDLFTMKTEQWQGPVWSEYGAHLLRIEHVTKSTVPDFADIRTRILDDVINEQLMALKEKTYQEMRTHYQVDVAYQADENSN